jgi:DNA mismatch repair protein MutS
MTSIQDLHFQKEILPLFDFTGNDWAGDALIGLLSERPASVEEVITRQDILTNLISHGELYAPFSYGRSEFNEVYRYTEEIGGREYHNVLEIHFLFAGTERSRERGRLSQLFIFLHKIRQAWFARLSSGTFPQEFENKLKNIHRLFADLDIEKNQSIARNRTFTIRELARLIGLVGEKCRNGEMAAFWKDLFLFEAWLSISKGIRKNHFHFPVFRNDGLTITGFYHPLVKNAVKNSLTTAGGVTLITGPNMSGKSTLLKSVGLCVVLAHLGLAVPAERCELPFFDVISIASNLNDDLKSGYSHFMTEIKALKNVAMGASRGQKCFAIFDELFRGTNVEDALAISKTTILGLSGFAGSCFFISTHLHQLKEMLGLQGDAEANNARNDRNKDTTNARHNDTTGTHNISTRYIECRLEKGMPVFTYQLREGWSDWKIGQIIFEQEGLNELLAGPDGHLP